MTSNGSCQCACGVTCLLKDSSIQARQTGTEQNEAGRSVVKEQRGEVAVVERMTRNQGKPGSVVYIYHRLYSSSSKILSEFNQITADVSYHSCANQCSQVASTFYLVLYPFLVFVPVPGVIDGSISFSFYINIL